MSLLEWFGESIDPGSVGSAEIGSRDRSGRSRISVIVCSIFATMIIGGWIYLLLNVFEIQSTKSILVATGCSILYLLIAYFIHPQPDMDNVGWLGGLMDHPFRYSDDLNRFLIFLMIFLFPGRFVSESLIDLTVLFFHLGNSDVEDERDDYENFNRHFD